MSKGIEATDELVIEEVVNSHVYPERVVVAAPRICQHLEKQSGQEPHIHNSLLKPVFAFLARAGDHKKHHKPDMHHLHSYYLVSTLGLLLKGLIDSRDKAEQID